MSKGQLEGREEIEGHKEVRGGKETDLGLQHDRDRMGFWDLKIQG